MYEMYRNLSFFYHPSVHPSENTYSAAENVNSSIVPHGGVMMQTEKNLTFSSVER